MPSPTFLAPRSRSNEIRFLRLIVVIVLAASVALVIEKKKPVTHQTESAVVSFNVKDFPEHGISLIAPSDSAFSKLQDRLTEPQPTSDYAYSVFLKNSGNRAVVGYSIKWECSDSRGDVSDRNLSNDRNTSNIVSWVFLHGEESDRRAAMNSSPEIIRPNSIWFISFDRPAHLLDGSGLVSSATNRSAVATPEGCASMTVTADGIFFDDGTFIGPDTTDFFTAIKSQMDARYELLQGIQNDLKAGKTFGEIFTGLEKIRNQEDVKLGERPTADEFRAYFRKIFVRDVLGKKEIWGADKAIEDVQRQLSKPWVNLRKL